MMGLPLMSSDQILAVQSPTVRKCSRDVSLGIDKIFYIFYFRKCRVPLKGADSTEMCRVDEAYPVLAFVLLLTGEYVPLLSSHHELGGDGPLVLQHAGALRPPGVSLHLQAGVKDQLV